MNPQLLFPNVSFRDNRPQPIPLRLDYSIHDLETVCCNCFCKEGIPRTFKYMQIDENGDKLGNNYSTVKLCDFCFQYSHDTSSSLPGCALDVFDFINQLSLPREKGACLCCQEYCNANYVLVRYFEECYENELLNRAVVGLCYSCWETYNDLGLNCEAFCIEELSNDLQGYILDGSSRLGR